MLLIFSFRFKVLYVSKISIIFCLEIHFVNFNLAPDCTPILKTLGLFENLVFVIMSTRENIRLIARRSLFRLILCDNALLMLALMRAKQFSCFNNSRSKVKIWHHISALSTKVISAAVCSNAVVPMLLILDYCCSHCLWGFGFWSMSCYAVLVNNLVFQSGESGLLYFNCLPDDFWLLVFCVSSLQCCELVCAE